MHGQLMPMATKHTVRMNIPPGVADVEFAKQVAETFRYYFQEIFAYQVTNRGFYRAIRLVNMQMEWLYEWVKRDEHSLGWFNQYYIRCNRRTCDQQDYGNSIPIEIWAQKHQITQDFPATFGDHQIVMKVRNQEGVKFVPLRTATGKAVFRHTHSLFETEDDTFQVVNGDHAVRNPPIADVA